MEVFLVFILFCEKYWNKSWIGNLCVFVGYKIGRVFVLGNWLLFDRMGVLGCELFNWNNF